MPKEIESSKILWIKAIQTNNQDTKVQHQDTESSN